MDDVETSGLFMCQQSSNSFGPTRPYLDVYTLQSTTRAADGGDQNLPSHRDCHEELFPIQVRSKRLNP